MTLAFYPIAGAEAFEVEMRARLHVNEDDAATAGNTAPTPGPVDGRQPAMLIASALIVGARFVDPVRSSWSD